MSKNNNVNPGQYKVAGRERQGEEVVHEREKAKASRTKLDRPPAAPRRAAAARPAKRKTA